MEKPLLYQRVLAKPPVCTVKDTTGKFNKEFWSSLSSCVKTVQEMDESLLTERQILDKLIYKYTGPFRREQVLSSLKKINKYIKRYREMCVQSYIDEMNVVVSESDYKRIPSTAMVTHLLQLLLRGSHCLQTTTVECLRCYDIVKQKLTAAVFVPTMLIFAAGLARVWYVCCALIRELTGLYEALKGQNSAVWATDAGPSLPDSIKYLIPCYGNDKVDNGDMFTSISKEDSTDDMDTNPAIKTNNKAVDPSDVVDVGEVLSRAEMEEDGFVNTVEDVGQIVTRLTKLENKEDSEQFTNKTDMERPTTSQQTEGTENVKNNQIIIKTSLKEFTLQVYSESKIYKRVVKKLTCLNCILVMRDQKVELNSATSKKLLKEIKSQNDIVKAAKTVDDKVTKAKKAAKRLEKKLNTYLSKMQEKRIDIDECANHETSDPIDQQKDCDLQTDAQIDPHVSKALATREVKCTEPSNQNAVKIPKKGLENFAFKIVSDKVERKSFLQKLKSGDCMLHYGKKKCKPTSDWTKNILILFKHLSRDLKGNTDPKSKILQMYGGMLIKQFKSGIK